jgi:hypothetical protein
MSRAPLHIAHRDVAPSLPPLVPPCGFNLPRVRNKLLLHEQFPPFSRSVRPSTSPTAHPHSSHSDFADVSNTRPSMPLLLQFAHIWALACEDAMPLRCMPPPPQVTNTIIVVIRGSILALISRIVIEYVIGGQGRSAPRFGGSGPCIVKVEQQFHCAFLDKWLQFFVVLLFLIAKQVLLLLVRRGDCGNYCVCLQFLTSEHRLHTWQIGVSIGVPCRRVHCPIFAP